MSSASRVLGGRGDSPVRPETKRRIFEGAGRLRYRPHARRPRVDRPASVKAAVLHATGEPLVVEDVELEAPRRDEIRVRITASGICHSDLSLAAGKWPAPLPMVLGHEGAGVIDAVGEGVDEARVGESVVLTFTPACGQCRFCLMGRVNLCLDAARCMDAGTLRDGTSRLRVRGRQAYHLALVSSFATHAVVPAAGAIRVSSSLDPSHACLLGCGVLTGFASVVRRAAVRPGESVAVFACGGVGLSTVIAARLVSATPIIAVDPMYEKRRLAMSVGATHVVDPRAEDPVAAVRRIVGDGVDHAFEAIGTPAVAAQAFAATRTGGTTVLIGQPALGVEAAFPVYELTQFEHDLLGTHIGGATPALDIPALGRLCEAGLIDLDPLVTHRLPLESVNEGMELTRAGRAGRVVLVMSRKGA